MYKVISKFESEQHEANLNLTKIIYDSDQSLKELKASSAQEDKPWSIILIFKVFNFHLYMVLCIKFVGVG